MRKIRCFCSGKLNKLFLHGFFLLAFVVFTTELHTQVFWTETFGTGCTHTNFVTTNGTWVSVNVGTNNTYANRWYMSAKESGNDPGTCGTSCTAANDKSMHVSTAPAIGGDLGAAYLAGGLGFFPCITSRRIESPTINCTGKYNITVSFNYIENGSGTLDDASMYYYNGTTWSLLDNMPKTPFGNCAPQGMWTNYTVMLPASANNNALVKIGFLWVNNDDNIGTDPSFAVDDITLSTPITNSITTGSVGGPLCACGAVNVPFTSTGTFTAGNIYTAQLSNASGSFASPVNIGNLSSTANSGTISANIPCGTAAGSAYRIRVVSSAPVATGTDNGTNLVINTPVTYYLDADGDGYYSNTTSACSSPGAGWSTTAGTSGDCNDNNAEINPGVEEGCNCVDDNCNGQVDETCDYDGDGYTTCNGDCDNYNHAINPAATEICNLIDDDCDGLTDEGFDADGDGFSTCAGDCNDANATYHPNTNWYADLDGDGYGSYIFATQCTNPGIAGVILQGGDCDDEDITIHTGVPEICQNDIDDNCNGLIDEGCSGIANDNRSNAQWILPNGYPQCAWVSGTCYNAAISPEGNPANVPAMAGRDVWYAFLAQSTAVQIRVQANNFDPLIELQTAAGTEIDMENHTGVAGLEILNFQGLTVGQSYFVAVRNYQISIGDSFTICISSIHNSYRADVNSSYEMCSLLKAKWTGADTYTFHFSPTGTTPGIPTTVSSNTQIPVGHTAAALRHGGTYSVVIDGIFNLSNGAGSPEILTVPGIPVSNFDILNHASVEVKAAQRCPSTLLKGSVLQGKPFVCAVLNYTVEFTLVTDCTGNTAAGFPFTVNTTGSSASINLNFTSPQPLLSNSHYKVRFKPNFYYGGGTFGMPQVIFIGGSTVEDHIINFPSEETERNMNVYSVGVYPNPSNGKNLGLNLSGISASTVEINLIDANARKVYYKKLPIESALSTQLIFEQELAEGIYLLYIVENDRVWQEKIMVAK